jgi:hypothetical protein
VLHVGILLALSNSALTLKSVPLVFFVERGAETGERPAVSGMQLQVRSINRFAL